MLPIFESDKNLILDIRNSAVEYHRLLLPYGILGAKPKVPVYIFNRISSKGEEFIRRVKSIGGKVILDLDDYPEVDKTHYLYEPFKQNKYSETIFKNLKLADYVTVTTEYLADRIRWFTNAEVIVIPNALPFDEGQFTLSQDKESGSPLVWAGGSSHRPDLTLIKDLDSECLTIVGYYDCEEWNKIVELMPKSTVEHSQSLNKYMDVYNGHKIALAPLVDNLFNNCKSNLKVLEAGAKGLPIITSQVLPYYNKQDEKHVLFAENTEEWNKHIAKLFINSDYYQDKSEALAEHVRTCYSLRKVNEIRRQLIESL